MTALIVAMFASEKSENQENLFPALIRLCVVRLKGSA